MQPGCNNHKKKIIKKKKRKEKSLLFGKGELFVDMSSFDTNVLSEKAPEFSMAVVEVKIKLEHILSWAIKKSLEMRRT